MTTVSSGSVQVLTFKEGVLSPLAHNLRLTLGRFELDLDGERISGRFDLESLSVDGAMEGAELRPEVLSDSQKREILDNVRRSILDTRRHPQVFLRGRFERDSAAYHVEGQLELRGQRQPIRLSGGREAGRVRGEVALQPSRWGIEPFRALFGAIRLQDRVVVRFDLPEPG